MSERSVDIIVWRRTPISLAGIRFTDNLLGAYFFWTPCKCWCSPPRTSRARPQNRRTLDCVAVTVRSTITRHCGRTTCLPGTVPTRPPIRHHRATRLRSTIAWCSSVDAGLVVSASASSSAFSSTSRPSSSSSSLSTPPTTKPTKFCCVSSPTRPVYSAAEVSLVRRPLWVNKPGQLSLLPSVGREMSSISVDRWAKLLAAVRPLANAYTKEMQMWCICRCDPHLSA